MANADRSPSAARASRIIVRLFFIVLACVLLLMGYDHYKPLVVGNDRPLTDGGCAGLLYFRDRRIDHLTPTIALKEDGGCSEAQVLAAVDALKDFFKLQKIEYGLCAVRFDETASQEILSQTPQPESGRYLALLADYNVYDDMGADKAGYYPNAVFVLRQQPDGSWAFPVTQSESDLLSPLVCPLEQHML